MKLNQILIYVLQLILLINLTLTLETSKTTTSNENDSKSSNLSDGCKYNKGRWQECDVSTGLQKRILKLKKAKSQFNNCSNERTIERPCKKQCKYSKGTWSECTNGFKERVDKLRSGESSSFCKLERIVNKACKKQCNYEKSDWTICENGFKNKTLTLIPNADTPNSPSCEPVKQITKPCTPKSAKNTNKRSKLTKKMRNQVP